MRPGDSATRLVLARHMHAAVPAGEASGWRTVVNSREKTWQRKRELRKKVVSMSTFQAAGGGGSLENTVSSSPKEA